MFVNNPPVQSRLSIVQGWGTIHWKFLTRTLLIKECVPILQQLSTINSFSLSGGRAVAPFHSCWKFDHLDLVLICTHNHSYYAFASRRHHFTSLSHLSTLKSFLLACQNLRGRGEGNVSHLGLSIQSLFPLFWPIRHICTVCCSL